MSFAHEENHKKRIGYYGQYQDKNDIGNNKIEDLPSRGASPRAPYSAFSFNVSDSKTLEELKKDKDFLQSHQYLQQVAANLTLKNKEDMEKEIEWMYNDSNVGQSSRPRLSNKLMLHGLVQQTDKYNKAVDRKVMTDSRIAFEDKQLKGKPSEDMLARELEQLAISTQHIPIRGRGDNFGRLRSTDSDDSARTGNHTSHAYANFRNDAHSHSPCSRVTSPNTRSAPPQPWNDTIQRAYTDVKKRFGNSDIMAPKYYRGTDNGAADINRNYERPQGRFRQEYRYNFEPIQAATPPPVPQTSAHPPRPILRNRITYYSQQSDQLPYSTPRKEPCFTQDYEKPLMDINARPVGHNYYNVYVTGSARNAVQRIEKTVRNTEAPPRF